jgi:hypothetical protein
VKELLALGDIVVGMLAVARGVPAAMADLKFATNPMLPGTAPAAGSSVAKSW